MEVSVNQITRRAILQRGGMIGAALALDQGRPDLARAAAIGSPERFRAIDLAMMSGVSRHDVAGVAAIAATPGGVVYEGSFGTANTASGTSMTIFPFVVPSVNVAMVRCFEGTAMPG